MNFVDCELKHATDIQAIFNEAICNSTALYEIEPRSLETVQAWMQAKADGNYPLFGIESDDGSLIGFATCGPFRSYAGYRFTVEHSVYVDQAFRGQGLGRRLLEELIRRATERRYHMMIGVIDRDNAASISMHEKLGFTLCGHVREAGFKFDRWLDIVFYQRVLE
jgi:L-amino acid N-acyltransferase